MSTPIMLLDELKAFAEEIVRTYVLETNQPGLTKQPKVITGYLPPKKSTPDPDYPFVIVRLSDGTDDQNGSTVGVRILVGTYSEDPQNGWRDVANIIWRMRTALLTTRVIGGRFRLEYPITFEMPEEQPFPEWVGVMDTVWILPQPVEEVIYE